jgi:nicotinamidase-related amidase
MPTALLVLHMQVGVTDQYGEQSAAVIERCRAAIDAAHAHEVVVIHGRLVFRAGRPESPPHRPANAFIAQFDEGLPTSQIVEALTPGPGDVVVRNTRGSSFTGSDLDQILRSRGCTDVALVGIGTGGVVLCTLLDAADRDYRVTVLSDACCDPDDDIHRVLLDKIFPRYGAKVVTVDAWAGTLG